MTKQINAFGDQNLIETKSKTSRRSFLRGGALAGAGLGLGAFTGLSAFASPSGGPGITKGDVAILQFLAAAELIETDLWDQYCEVAQGGTPYGNALNVLENEMVIYTCDVAMDERSHAKFINHFLAANGFEPTNLDAFRTLPSSTAQGAIQKGRLTNLLNITVDTSWYLRYRDTGNPDFGDTYPQFVDIVDKPVIPIDNRKLSDNEIQLIANSAAFHFCTTESTGASIYPSLIPKVTNLDVLRILMSIGPTEAYFFCSFHQSLEGLPAISGDGLVFPDVKINDIGAHHIPHTCKFLDLDLPHACVVRPTHTENGGAVHLIQAGITSGLFKGQSNKFLDKVMNLAMRADAASRSL